MIAVVSTHHNFKNIYISEQKETLKDTQSKKLMVSVVGALIRKDWNTGLCCFLT